MFACGKPNYRAWGLFKKKKKKTYMIREWFTRLEHILLISAGVWAIIRPKCPGHSNYYCLILVVSSALLQLNCEEI